MMHKNIYFVSAVVLLLAACKGSNNGSTPTVEPSVEPTELVKIVGDCFEVQQGDELDPIDEESQISIKYTVTGDRQVCVTAGRLRLTQGI